MRMKTFILARVSICHASNSCRLPIGSSPGGMSRCVEAGACDGLLDRDGVHGSSGFYRHPAGQQVQQEAVLTAHERPTSRFRIATSSAQSIPWTLKASRVSRLGMAVE